MKHPGTDLNNIGFFKKLKSERYSREFARRKLESKNRRSMSGIWLLSLAVTGRSPYEGPFVVQFDQIGLFTHDCRNSLSEDSLVPSSMFLKNDFRGLFEFFNLFKSERKLHSNLVLLTTHTGKFKHILSIMIHLRFLKSEQSGNRRWNIMFGYRFWDT